MGMWHHLPVSQLLAQLETNRQRGLTGQQARRRLEQYGKNELEGAPGRSMAARLAGQLKDPMILVLLGAAGLSLLASGGADWIDAVIILVIVVVNAVISISQESNAEKALEALKKLSSPMARAVREGEPCRLDASLLVPGDIILLEAGDLVPADGRILECAGLRADESALTGESTPVAKEAADSLPEDTPVGDRKNMLLASTVITGGRATAVVTATGMDTEVGRIASLLLGQEEGQTPLQKKMGEISRTLSFLCLAVCAVMFGVGLIQGKNLLDMFLTAVALAVAAIPEGLPAIVTIVLALGVQRMVRRNAIVKKLPAVETLGCAGVICTDKTGTLTQNRMTVTRVWTLEPGGRTAALTVGALCSDAALTVDGAGRRTVTGDPTEAALVEAAAEAGLDKNRLEQAMPRAAELPFDSRRKLMSTVHPLPEGGWRILVKGAPDVLLERSTSALTAAGPAPLTGPMRRRILDANEAMAGQALRVLGMAWRDVPAVPARMTSDQVERELTFVGLAGMMDPPRPEVKGAVERCFAAGIRPVIITGDHKATAVAIARQLNILRPGDAAVTGEELDFLSQELLEQEVERISVYARVSPEHKMRIVRAWQARGCVVAMTGDGVNDAPALKAADIGCAMGLSGTDVARGAADMILTDDNFSTIVHAVEEGRGIYANIRKAIHYLLSCNIGEIVTIFLATALNFRQMPLLPVQLLWLNLVTDSLPALALGVEPVEAGVMRQPPRRAGESLFAHGFAFRLIWQGLLVGGVTLAAWWLGEHILSRGQAISPANTMAFATLTLSQLFHAFDVRSQRQSIFDLGVFSNRAMNRAFCIGMALQLLVLTVPVLREVFGVVLLRPAQWITVLALSLVPVFLCETAKWAARKERRDR